MRRRTFLQAAAGIAFAGDAPLFAAPAPKEQKPNLGPITEQQLADSANNLKQIGLAFHNHVDTNEYLPSNLKTRDGKVGLSWRVAVLPFIEEDHIYKQLNLDEAWDSEHNAKFHDKMPKLFEPTRGARKKGETFYLMFSGPQGMIMADGTRRKLTSATDGLSNTIFVAESAKPVNWMRPDDMPFDGKKIPPLGGMFDGRFHTVMGDGSVHRIRKNADPDVMRLLIDRADGVAVDLAKVVDKDEK